MSPATSQPTDPRLVAALRARLATADAEYATHYPGRRLDPQPVHTVYISGADTRPGVVERWGADAVALAERHRDTLVELDVEGVLDRTLTRLATSPIADLRADFEDGYGTRPDAVEDADARAAGATFAQLAADPDGPAHVGIRFKGLTADLLDRSLRTLELVLDGAGGVPRGFVVTIPKFRALEQVDVAVELFDAVERAHGLPAGALRFELQIETPQAVLGADGTATVARAVHASAGRCTGLHYGTYDYSAACGITAAQQSLEHPVADHAKAVMLLAAAQTGVWVSDGSTQVTPTGDTAQQQAAVRRHHRLVTRSLERGVWQGWDMHPGHLVTRWLATFAFHRQTLTAAAPRIQSYLDRRGGDVMDEPATAEALAAGVLRGLDAGAFDDADVQAAAPSCDRAVLDALVRRRDVAVANP